MAEAVDVAIVGLGAMGAAIAWQASRRGLSVVGFDARQPPHQDGSSHGHSRIIREAYFEHPQYVPLVQRSYELWAELEAEARTRLFQATGGVMIGREGSVLIEGTRRAAREHRLRIQTWSHRELADRVPGVAAGPDMIGLFEPRAGVLAPERAVSSMLGAAAAGGAALHLDEPVVGWHTAAAGIEVWSDRRRVRAGCAILSAGPWVKQLLGGLALPLVVERVVQYWYRPGADPRFLPGNFPVFLLETPDGRMLYGLPDQGHGLKLAEHHGGAAVDIADVQRAVSVEEQEAFHGWASDWIHGLPGEPADRRVCLYTNTPDGDFVLDWHPTVPRLFICSACSGHGFKFAPAIGEAVASLATDGTTRFDLTPFRSGRLA